MKKKFLLLTIGTYPFLLTSCFGLFINKDNENNTNENQINLGESVNNIAFQHLGKTYEFNNDMDLNTKLSKFSEIIYDVDFWNSLIEYEVDCEDTTKRDPHIHGYGFQATFLEEIDENTLKGYEHSKLNTSFDQTNYYLEGYEESLNDIKTEESVPIESYFLAKENENYTAGLMFASGSLTPLYYNGKQLETILTDNFHYSWIDVIFNTNLSPNHLFYFDQEYEISSPTKHTISVLENTTYNFSLYTNYIVLHYESKIPFFSSNNYFNTVANRMDDTIKNVTTLYYDIKNDTLAYLSSEGESFINDRWCNISIDSKISKPNKEYFENQKSSLIEQVNVLK